MYRATPATGLPRVCARLLAASAALYPAGGCVGWLMGWSDDESDRLRQIVAELEAKNAALAAENLQLRRALQERPAAAPPAGSGAAGATGSQADVIER